MDELTDGTVCSTDAATVADLVHIGNHGFGRENVMTRSTIIDQALISQSEPGSDQKPPNLPRRTVIGGALVGLLAFPGRVMAQGKAVPHDLFVLLLKGLYQPVVHGPDSAYPWST